MKRNLLLMMCSICFVILLISNSANAMYLTTTTSPDPLNGEIDDSFDITVKMNKDAMDTTLLTSFSLNLVWFNDIVDNVTFTNLFTSGNTFTDAVVDTPGMYQVRWNLDPNTIPLTTDLGTFSFSGNKAVTAANLQIYLSSIGSLTGGELGTGYDQPTLVPITITEATTGPGSPVPEPATMLLFGLGLLGLAGVNRRKK